MEKIRVLIADDHAILRDGIRALLEAEPDMQVAGEAEDGRRAVQLAGQLAPDVVLMDVAMPLMNGIEATRQIKRYSPKVSVLILTAHEDEEYIRQALQSGAAGYLLKEADFGEVLAAMRSVVKGDFVLSPPVTRLVIEEYLRWGDLQPSPGEDELTCREREVLQLIAEGYTNREIAGIMCISVKTVQAHRARLMQKLDLHDRGELIKYAIQKKIIEI